MTPHSTSIGEILFLYEGLSAAGVLTAVARAGYIAIEPYMRGYWPDSLISWTRLWSGRLNDPLFASHMLVGAAAGTTAVTLSLVAIPISAHGRPLYIMRIESLSSVAALAANILTAPLAMLLISIATLFVVVLLR